MKHAMNNSPVLNRTGTLPEDGWYHIAPIGEFPVTTEGKRVMQVIDDKAVTAMAAQPIDGAPLLVDYDHFSYDPERSSEAAGWITALESRADGLYAKIEWTDTGGTSVQNKRYRFVSPVWYPGDCEPVANGKIRPLRLDSIALTNSPNLKGMRPLSNRGTADEPLINRAGEEQMKELITLLGLAETATDADVVAAVTALKTRADEAPALKNRAEVAEGKLKAAETMQLESDADAFCEQHQAHITNRDQVRGQFIANRAGTEALFAGLNLAPTKQESLKNRATGNPDNRTVVLNRQQQQAAAVAKIKNSSPAMRYEQAFEQARRESPELFKEETEGQ